MTEIIGKVECKNCGSDAVVKYGQYKGIQRYFCKACQRKFKGDNALFHMKVSPEHISTALSMYYSGSSISDIRNHLKQEHGYYPSKSVVFDWVNKYTDLATKQFRDYHPKVGNTWIADETMLDLDKNHKVWFWDIIDEKTRFLLASHVSLTRTTEDAQSLMEKAAQRAGKVPKVVVTDKLNAYLDGVELAFGADTEHRQGAPFRLLSSEESTSRVERFHGTIKDRTKVMRAFRDVETLIQFMEGYLVYYNYFKPHEALNGKTPAEVAGLDYRIKNWKDLSRLPVSKQEEIRSHKAPKTITPKAKVNLRGAFKRHRMPRITPRVPRITPKVGMLA
ncbi:MAG: DDE-type integrase/transposase/recombinase [Chloroflexota bacterium]